jgi:putative Mg2+ transporter-C (MgtC) family protein
MQQPKVIRIFSRVFNEQTFGIMPLLTEDIIKLLLSTLIGGIIGAEREHFNKSAGLRTIILICAGACLFTIMSIHLGGTDDPARIASNILPGIGFLGAGAIFKAENRVKGLTTASTIWLTAAIGMTIGTGFYLLSGFAAVLNVVVLLLFKRLQPYLEKADMIREYRIVCHFKTGLIAHVENVFRENDLSVERTRQSRIGDVYTAVWKVQGHHSKHDGLVEALIRHPDLQEFSY